LYTSTVTLALSKWWQETQRTLTLTGLALFALLIMAIVLLRRVRLSIRAEEQLQEERRLAARVFEHSTDGIIVTDADRRMIAVNPKLEAITGYQAAELIGRNPKFFASGRHDPDFYREMWATIVRDGFWRGEITNRRKDGSLVDESLSISQVLDSNGRLTNYVGVFQDISAERIQALRLQRQLAALRALNDIVALTGLEPRETMRAALRVAVDHLRLPNGIISFIDRAADRYRVEVQVSPPDTLADGQEFPLGNTYCLTTLESGDLFAVANAERDGWGSHPCFRAYQLAAYLGAPIRVDGEIRGTINFSSPTGRNHDFDPSDLEFVRMLARWAGAFLERMRALAQLEEARERSGKPPTLPRAASWPT
jgi:PAS domain S-box-containing protein